MYVEAGNPYLFYECGLYDWVDALRWSEGNCRFIRLAKRLENGCICIATTKASMGMGSADLELYLKARCKINVIWAHRQGPFLIHLLLLGDGFGRPAHRYGQPLLDKVPLKWARIQSLPKCVFVEMYSWMCLYLVPCLTTTKIEFC